MKKFVNSAVLSAILVFFVSVGSAFADQMIFQPEPTQGKDMWLSSSYNQTAVDNDKLEVGGWGDIYMSFIEFDLTDLPDTATSATMYMYAYPRGDSSTPVSMNIYLLTSSWDEQTQDYSDPLYGYHAGTLSAPTPNYWYGINITSIYNGWQDDTYANNGFVFIPTAINNQFNVFRSSDYSDYVYRPKLVVNYDGANFGFPLSGYTPYNAPIGSVIDHSVSTGFGNKDGVVTTFTGESGDVDYGCKYWLPDNSFGDCYSYNYQNYAVVGFKNQSSSDFLIGVNYDSGVSGQARKYLFYDGHTGYDYPVSDGTDVKAAASGTAFYYGDEDDVEIVHSSGYKTYYLHLSSRNVYDGQPVTKGDKIGETGSGHLHFTVKKSDGTRVDPYGWQGEYGNDPLQISDKDNVCLWDSCQ